MVYRRGKNKGIIKVRRQVKTGRQGQTETQTDRRKRVPHSTTTKNKGITIK